MRDAAGFKKKKTFKALNIPFKKVVLPGRVKYGQICGPEGEIVVAHGRLTSPAREITHNIKSL